MARISAEVLVTKKLEKYVDAAENDFKIDLNYSLKQWVTELSDSDKESPSSMHRSKVNSLYTATLSPQDKLDNELTFTEEEEIHLQQLKKKYYWAKVQVRILRLEREEFYGFALKKVPTESESSRPRLNKNALVLKKAKKMKYLDIYTDQSQKHLDKYFRQVKSTFQSKPTIYGSKKDKYIYAGEYLRETLAHN